MDIHARFDDLEAHLHAINMKSLEYFQELDNNNALISDERLKAQDAAKTQEIKLKWQQEYQKAAASMENTKKMLKEGDDFMYLLRNEVLRSAVSESIASLSQISTQAVAFNEY
ncbi:MAG: hypothetical protein IPM81_21405 [Saprospirales bacterium]|nr:hypothetical protein [Saprospirales bacterium]